MSLLSKGAEWLERQRHAYLTVDVEYQRDVSVPDGQTVLPHQHEDTEVREHLSSSGTPGQLALRATIGRTIFETTDDYGQLIRIESRDFLIRASDLIISEQITTPKPGDLIHESSFTYEVMSPVGEPEWRYSDVNRQTIRIHTKQV